MPLCTLQPCNFYHFLLFPSFSHGLAGALLRSWSMAGLSQFIGGGGPGARAGRAGQGRTGHCHQNVKENTCLIGSQYYACTVGLQTQRFSDIAKRAKIESVTNKAESVTKWTESVTKQAESVTKQLESGHSLVTNTIFNNILYRFIQEILTRNTKF